MHITGLSEIVDLVTVRCLLQASHSDRLADIRLTAKRREAFYIGCGKASLTSALHVDAWLLYD